MVPWKSALGLIIHFSNPYSGANYEKGSPIPHYFLIGTIMNDHPDFFGNRFHLALYIEGFRSLVPHHPQPVTTEFAWITIRQSIKSVAVAGGDRLPSVKTSDISVVS